MATGNAGSIVSQGVATATGLQDKFDGLGVAVAGVVSGVSAQTGKWMGIKYDARTLGSYAQQTAAGLAGAVAGAGLRSAITGTGFGDNILSTVPDVVAATIGNMIAYGVEAKAAAPAPEAPGDWPEPDFSDVQPVVIESNIEGVIKQLPPMEGASASGAASVTAASSSATGGELSYFPTVVEGLTGKLLYQLRDNIDAPGLDRGFETHIADYSAGGLAVQLTRDAGFDVAALEQITDFVGAAAANPDLVRMAELHPLLVQEVANLRETIANSQPIVVTASRSRAVNRLADQVGQVLHTGAYMASTVESTGWEEMRHSRNPVAQRLYSSWAAIDRGDPGYIDAVISDGRRYNAAIAARTTADIAKFERQVGGTVLIGPLLGAGAGLPVVAGGTATLLGGGTTAYVTASAATGGTMGLVIEGYKNHVLDKKGTPGGYISAGMFGSLGLSSLQLVRGASPAVNRAVAGGTSGFVGDLTGQVVDVGLGYYDSLDESSLIRSTLIGGAVGGLIPDVRVPGVTAGRNNWGSVYQGAVTRRDNGYIFNISPRVSLRGVAAGQLIDVGRTGSEATATILWERQRGR